MSAAPILETHDTGTGRSAVERVDRSWRAIGSGGQAVTVLASASALVVTTSWTGSTRYAVASGLSLAVLVVAAMVDAVERRLPNALVVVASVPVLVGGAIAYVLDDGAFISLGLGAVYMAGPLLLAHLVSPAGMGFGDVKAAAVLGGALGLINDDLTIPALIVALALVGGWGLARGRRAVPFGPGLVAGALVVLVVGRAVGA